MANQKPRAACQRRSLRFETLEDRLALTTVLPFSQLGVTSSGIYPGGAVDQAFSGEGLTGELHSDLWHEGWLSNGGGAAGEWIKVDLGGTYNIDHLRAWNGNQTGLTTRGIKQADIYVAISDPGNNIDNSGAVFNPTGWSLAVADQQFIKSPGGAAIVNTDPQINLGGVQAAFLAIRIDSSWGDAFVALSEMQIYEGTPATTAPAPPSSLQATAVSTSKIDLTWSDNSSDETSFHVYQSTDGTNFAPISGAGLAANSTSFSVTGLADNTTYHYRVLASNAIGDSPFSNTSSAQTLEQVEASVKLYVSTTGSDSNAGTLASPFASLEKARDEVQLIKNSTGLPDGGIAVVLRGGTYQLTSTFQIGSADSGSPGKPITYTSFPGEQARITGGQSLDSQLFSPVTSVMPIWNLLDTQARPNIVFTDLNAQGITDYGSLTSRNVFSDGLGALHLYFNDQPMTLARWPDKAPEDSPANYPDGSPLNGFADIDTALSDTAFTYEGNRPDRWTSADDIWLHGFFFWDWKDSHVPVNSINTATNTINIPKPDSSGIKSGQRYYAYNIVEEITQPGEWYLDRSDGKLYFWAPSDINVADIYVSMLSQNAIELQNTSWVVLQDLIVEGGRSNLVTIQDGSNNLIERSTIRHSGSLAVEISGSNNTIQDSEIAYTADGAIRVSGGDRVNLTPANNVVRNNEIHHFGEWGYSYKAGIKVEGVGQQIDHNELYQSPHVALQWEGNEHVMEYNELHNVTRFAADMGAMYSGRDWGWRGNVIRHNFIHDIYTWVDVGAFPFEVHGVYLDDALSGTTVFGNHFYNIEGYGVVNGGGRDNFIENNIFSRTGVPLFSDNRGVVQINFINNSSWNLIDRIQDDGISYQTGIWASTYPELAVIPTSFPTNDSSVPWGHPQGTTFSRNLSYATWWTSGSDIFDNDVAPGTQKPSDSFAEIADNVRLQDPLFVNEATLDLNLQPNSPALAIPGFVDIPFDQIGRYAVTVPLPNTADFDSDGDVDGADFLSWQRGFGTDAGSGNPAPLTSGNANGDQFVNENDLAIWQGQFGQVGGEASGAAQLKATPLATTASTALERAFAVWDTNEVERFGNLELAVHEYSRLARSEGDESGLLALATLTTNHNFFTTQTDADPEVRRADRSEVSGDGRAKELELIDQVLSDFPIWVTKVP